MSAAEDLLRAEFERFAASGEYAWLYRHALQFDQVDFAYPVTLTGRWQCRYAQGDIPGMLQAFLTESLATALLHTDRKLATRAAFQAKGYLERLGAMNASVGGPRFHDAVREAIERVVSWV